MLIDIVQKHVGNLLKGVGFRKSGQNYYSERNGITLLIQIQKSDRSSAERSILTVNLGVFSPTVAKRLGHQILRPTIAQCHWRQRVGHLFPVPSDKWWSMSDPDGAKEVAQELVDALLTFGLPTLQTVDSNEKLEKLWKSGAGPGLTDGQRKDYLKALASRPA